MKNSKKAAQICTIMVLLMTTGCSHSDADPDVSTVETINYDDVIDTDVIDTDVIDADVEENDSDNQNIKENVVNQPDSDEKIDDEESANRQSDNPGENDDSQQNNNEEPVKQSDSTQSQSQSQSDSELDGNIESIADNSVVINKTFHPSANTSVSYSVDSEKVLVTAYFSAETEFEVWTVKNGGVNGDADTEKRQGSFSDLVQDAHINVTGSYEGNDFHAKHVIIYHFV